jgi:hypothetical protein
MCCFRNRTWSFRFGSFKRIDKRNNILTAVTGDHELLETIITCFKVLFFGRGASDEITAEFHEWLSGGMSRYHCYCVIYGGELMVL